MTDIQILTQLLNGHHLEPKEVIRAGQILETLNNELETRKTQ